MIGLLISLLSHSSFLLPLLTHNSYCISCCCSLLAFSSTTAAKPGLSRGSHSCMEGSATAWLSLCSDTASKVQALQELVEPYRKEQVFHLVLLSKSKEHANAYEEEVRSCLVTCYTNWRPVVPVGKRKPKKLSAARSPQIQAVRPCRGQHSPHCMTAVLPDQINPKWHPVLQSILLPCPGPQERKHNFFFFTLDALTLPSLPSGPGSAASTPAWLCAAYSGVCSWRALPAAAPQSRLGGSFPLPSHGGEVSACGTAAATEPPGSPRPLAAAALPVALGRSHGLRRATAPPAARPQPRACHFVSCSL